MKRNEIESRYKWDLTKIVNGDAEWEALFKECKNALKTAASFAGKLTDKPGVLACLKSGDETGMKLERLYVYSHMKMDEDTREDKYQGMNDRAEMLLTEYSAATAYVTPELTALPETTLKEFIADPDFADYDYMLAEILRQKAHILSAGEERLLALSGDFASSFKGTFGMLDNADIKFKPVKDADGNKVQVTHGTYSELLQSRDQKVRAAAFKSMYTAFSNLINTVAANYAGNVKKNVFYTRARNYKSCLDRALEGDDVPRTVYDRLVAAVNANLAPVHEYVEYRAQTLAEKADGDFKLHMYDMYVPLVENAELRMEYEDACKLVTEALVPMGTEYAGLLKKAYTEGWIDVHENEGKRSGAYSWGAYGAHPYVLLNYHKTTHDVFTIAHELGHAMHSYYSDAEQCYHKAGYSIFVAEVASTVNEVLLIKHLLKKYAGDAAVTKYLLSYYLDMFRTTLFRQTMFAEFEMNAHDMAEKGRPLTAKALSDMYLKLNKKYYGKAVQHDKMIRFEWARIPHFYNAFYVYKYSTGLTSAVCIAESILSEGAPAVERYKTFLKSGGSRSPYEILKTAGVDLATEQPYAVAMGSFRDALAQLKK